MRRRSRSTPPCYPTLPFTVRPSSGRGGRRAGTRWTAWSEASLDHFGVGEQSDPYKVVKGALPHAEDAGRRARMRKRAAAEARSTYAA